MVHHARISVLADHTIDFLCINITNNTNIYQALARYYLSAYIESLMQCST